MENFIQILRHTPWWVYLVFAYIVYAGIKAAKPRRVPMLQLMVFPCIFTVLSIQTLVGRMGDHVLYLVPWSIAVITGMVVGGVELHRMTIVVDRKNRRLLLPGSVVTPLLFLLLFGTQYYYGFLQATAPERLKGIHLKIRVIL